MAVGDGAGSGAVRRLARQLDLRAVGRGAAAYVAIAVPCGIVIAALKGNDAAGRESNLWIVAAVIMLLVAPVVGGALAGRTRPDAPLVHGAAAVILPAAGFLLVRVAAGLLRGNLTLPQVMSFILFAQVFTGLGTLGAYVATRRAT